MISLTALFIIFAAVIGSTAMMGVLAWFFNRIRRLEDGGGGGIGAGRLAERLEETEEELLALRREMRSLAERVDFTEKLLTSGDDASPPEGEPT